ncbi:MAG: hypothetical protein MI974_13295 [Chitinophagales bacterium]|nr:hypothetical protein [Chitinophagales bacterium]
MNKFLSSLVVFFLITIPPLIIFSQHKWLAKFPIILALMGSFFLPALLSFLFKPADNKNIPFKLELGLISFDLYSTYAKMLLISSIIGGVIGLSIAFSLGFQNVTLQVIGLDKYQEVNDSAIVRLYVNHSKIDASKLIHSSTMAELPNRIYVDDTLYVSLGINSSRVYLKHEAAYYPRWEDQIKSWFGQTYSLELSVTLDCDSYGKEMLHDISKLQKELDFITTAKLNNVERIMALANKSESIMEQWIKDKQNDLLSPCSLQFQQIADSVFYFNNNLRSVNPI